MSRKFNELIEVALAVITDEHYRILVTQRSLQKTQGGLWELPGGKLEQGEEPEQALIRELREELGIEVLQALYLDEIVHHYPQYSVRLLIFHVPSFKGTPFCLDGQMNMKWVLRDAIDPEDFPEANRIVFDKLSPAQLTRESCENLIE